MSQPAPMQNYFMDSSALVKRYAIELGSAWVTALRAPSAANIIVIANITVAEVAAALGGKFRGGFLSQPLYDQAFTNLLAHARNDYVVRAIDQVIIEAAAQLTRQHKLRGYDAVQLASALRVNQRLMATRTPALIFVSADHNLLAAAHAEGLPTDNPNAHP